MNKNPLIMDLVQADIPEDVKNRESLMSYLEVRRTRGYEKYGVYLQANNGRSALQDSRDEACDLVMYARQAIEEGNTRMEIVYKIALDLLFYIQNEIASHRT